jgi:hypothetical protein
MLIVLAAASGLVIAQFGLLYASKQVNQQTPCLIVCLCFYILCSFQYKLAFAFAFAHAHVHATAIMQYNIIAILWCVQLLGTRTAVGSLLDSMDKAILLMGISATTCGAYLITSPAVRVNL